MAVKQLDDGRIADDFQIGTVPLVLSDSLIMSPDDYAALTADQVQALKQARYDNWITLVTAASNDQGA